MLEEMHIRGLGVIDDAQLELDPGFTAVTGETGAGKTMVVTGLSLLLGARADAGLVRPGATRAVVEGRLRLPDDSPAARRADDAGAELEDGRLIIVRSVSAEGGSRAHAGGTAVPVRLLADLADDLVVVHGQSDQRRLLSPAEQREVLDRYAGAAVLEPKRAYAERYARLRSVTAELDELIGQAHERAREADVLRFGLGEIEAVAPTGGEDTELAAEEARLAHADALRAAAEHAHLALAGAEDPGFDSADAVSAVAAARKALEGVRDHDPALAALADRVAEISYLLGDVAADLASYGQNIDTDPARLQAVSERRAALAGLTRKYGETIDDVLTWAETAAKRLIELEGSDERIDRLRAERDRLRAELADLAAELSAARSAAAEKFAGAVTAELAALAMPDAHVHVAVTPTFARTNAVGEPTDPDTALHVAGTWYSFGPHGIDEVEFRLSPHPGAPARPIQRGASGGELSRVMLAVEVVVAEVDKVPTFVFDEVDAGVAGRAAVEIGRRLARLARHAQVIVVTHLPQVAAFADRHYVVRKSSDGAVTRSGPIRLEGEERVDELARMLAGLDDSESARTHARELLAGAEAERAAGVTASAAPEAPGAPAPGTGRGTKQKPKQRTTSKSTPGSPQAKRRGANRRTTSS